jgi:small subunit ribosomal protein S6e
MVSFKLVLSNPKTGKSYQREVKEPEANAFIGKKIKDTISGDQIGLAGWEFRISGGSDFCGFPMRADVKGTARKRIYAFSGVGIRKGNYKGQKQRKSVCGNVIGANTVQINLTATKEGSGVLGEDKPKEKKE